MLTDDQLQLTASGGHDMTAAVLDVALYGNNPFDLRQTTARDIAVGEPISAFFQCLTADMDDITSCAIAVICDTDGAGGSAVVLLTKTVLLASLTVAAGVQRIGTIDPGLITHRYLTARLTPTGGSAPENACHIKVFLQAGLDVTPANKGRTI